MITESVVGLQEVANRWYQAAIEIGMRINTRLGKTEEKNGEMAYRTGSASQTMVV